MTVLFSVILFLFPQIDLAVSRFFYQPQRGFLLAVWYDEWHLEIFRDILVYITYAVITVLILMLIIGLWFKPLKMPISPKICLFLLISFAIAPALVVNGVLKDHWGRARPYQTQLFGGDKQFTPVWVISDQCEKNCSFTCGETANVFCYLALLFVARRKKLILATVLAVGALTAFERIAQGDHFISDTILSGLIDYLLIWLVYHTINYYSARFEPAGELCVKNN